MSQKPVGIRFTTAQMQWLRAEAKRCDRTVAWIVRRAVDETIKQSKKPEVRNVKAS